MIKVLNDWWLRKKSNGSSNSKAVKRDANCGYVAFTHYPYEYKTKREKILKKNAPEFADTLEAKRRRNADLRCLFVPRLAIHSKESIRLYKNVFFADCKAHYTETLNLLNFNVDNVTGCNRLAAFVAYTRAMAVGSRSVARLEKVYAMITRNCFVRRNTTIHFGDTIERLLDHRDPAERAAIQYKFLYSSMHDKNWECWYRLVCATVRNIIEWSTIADDGPDTLADLYVAYPAVKRWLAAFLRREPPADFETEVASRVLDNVHEIRNLMNIPLKNGSVKDQIQGRRSAMRRDHLSPKTLTCRAQIALRFDLRPNEMVMPLDCLDRLKLFTRTMNVGPFDLRNCTPQPDRLVDVPSKYSFVLKRDPVIDKNSIVAITRVGFARTDMFHISPYILHGQNADFDGDAENVYIVDNYDATREIKLVMLPECNIYNGFLNLQLQFTETHVYFMHKRDLPAHHPFYDKYREFKRLITKQWFADSANRNSLVEFVRAYGRLGGNGHTTPSSPDTHEKIDIVTIFDNVEPTALVLETFALWIYVRYGAKRTSEFFYELNDKLLEISNGIANDWSDPRLDSLRVVDRNVLCEELLKIALSGSKGSLVHYMDILEYCKREKKVAHDEGGLASRHGLPLDRDARRALITDLTTSVHKALVGISDSVRKIPRVGHESFKSLIEWNGLSIINNSLYYNTVNIVDNVDEFFFANYMFDERLTLNLIANIINT